MVNILSISNFIFNIFVQPLSFPLLSHLKSYNLISKTEDIISNFGLDIEIFWVILKVTPQ